MDFEKLGVDIMPLEEMGKLSKEAARGLIRLSKTKKRACLISVAKNLIEYQQRIIDANKVDIQNGEKNGMSQALLDRLRLTEDRIENMAQGLRQVAGLEDPIGEVISMKERPCRWRSGDVRQRSHPHCSRVSYP